MAEKANKYAKQRALTKSALKATDYGDVVSDAFKEYAANPRNPLSLINMLFSPITAAGRKAGDATIQNLPKRTPTPIKAGLATAADIGVNMIDPQFMAKGALGLLPILGGVVKGKGGNWLTSTVDDALRPLLKPIPSKAFDAYGNEVPNILANSGVYADNAAINSWINGPLRNYVMRDTATPDDPVRKLAEQGVLHYTPGRLSKFDKDMLAAINPNRSQMGKSRLAKLWENVTDKSIHSTSAGALQEKLSSNDYFKKKFIDYLGGPDSMGFVPKLDPESQLHYLSFTQNSPAISSVGSEALGFSHLVDELSNALSPDLLPQHLRLTPEQLKQMGMEKAVRHVDAINKYRAELEAAKNVEMLTGIPTIREYAENNPKGLRWVELAAPSELPKSVRIEEKPYKDYVIRRLVSETGDDVGGGWFGHPEQGYPDPVENYRIFGAPKDLQNQLKYAGDTMGHCVGGYCDKVLGGQSRIFSLRDAKGEPHVTIETSPKQWFYEADKFPDPTGQYENFHRLVHSSRKGDGDYEEVARKLAAEHGLSLPHSIVQIKGKQNRKPNDEYLPFVQDFVKNNPLGGDWADVGDFGNTGLKRLSDMGNEPMIKAAREKFGDYVTPEEWDSIMKGGEGFAQGGVVGAIPPVKKASGGLVENSYDPSKIDAIIEQFIGA